MRSIWFTSLLQESKHVHILGGIRPVMEYQWLESLIISYSFAPHQQQMGEKKYFLHTRLLFSDIFTSMPLLCGEFPLWQTVGLPRWQLAQWHTFTLSVTQLGSQLPNTQRTLTLSACLTRLKVYMQRLYWAQPPQKVEDDGVLSRAKWRACLLFIVQTFCIDGKIYGSQLDVVHT